MLRVQKLLQTRASLQVSYIARAQLNCCSYIFLHHVNAMPSFSNSFGLKNVFEKLCFRDGLVWTVGFTVEIKLRFSNFFGVAWTGP